MRPLAWIGLVVLILGILAFFVPLPMSHTHSAKVGDTSIGITTHTQEKVSPALGGLICAAGVVLLVAGARKSA